VPFLPARISYSSASRNYDGTYSAQRQELVESTDGYFVLQDWFIGSVTRHIYRAWLNLAILSGKSQYRAGSIWTRFIPLSIRGR
jgi:capsid protein